jgi:hypothetical protein
MIDTNGKQTKFSIKHMNYKCPIGKDVNLNVFGSTFSGLFSSHSKILLPVFQRRYCWNSETNQLQNWWRDMNKTLEDKHHVGKIRFFEALDGLLVIDGQQRICTTLIVLCSLRDSLEKFDCKDKKIQQLKSDLNSVFFSNQKMAHEFKENLKEGELLDFIRFSPTFLDRLSFYSIILGISLNFHQDEDFIMKSKHFFDEKFSSLEVNTTITIYNQLMNEFSFVHMGIPESQLSKGFFIYQWYFEKSLWVEKAFSVKSPGVKHTVQELVKNFVLSFFIQESYKNQNQIYHDLWIRIEKYFNSQIKFEEHIKTLIKSQEEEPYDIYRDFVDFIEPLVENSNDHVEFMKIYLKNFFNKIL